MKLYLVTGIGWASAAMTLAAPALIDSNTRNGSFESGIVAPWEGDVAVAEDSAFAQHGSWYGMVERTAGSIGNVRALAFQFFTANPNDGRRFIATFSARTDTAGFNEISVDFFARSSSGVFAKAIEVPLAFPDLSSTEWRTYQVQYDLPETWDGDGVVSLQILFNKHNPIEGTSYAAYLDNVTLQAVPVPSNPEIKNFTFQGTIQTVDDLSFVLDGSVTNGAPFEGFYTFSPKAVDSNSDPTVGDYWFTDRAYGMVVKVGNYVFRTNPNHVDFLIEVVDRPDRDNYLLRSYHNLCSRPLPIDHIAWQLDDPTGNALTDASLPLAPPLLSAYQSLFGLTLEGVCSSFLIRGHVTSIHEAPTVIPERPAVEIMDAVEVQWPSRLGYFYQIQRSEDMDTWTNVGEPVLGDGTTLSRFFARQPGIKAFYRAEIANFPQSP